MGIFLVFTPVSVEGRPARIGTGVTSMHLPLVVTSRMETRALFILPSVWSS